MVTFAPRVDALPRGTQGGAQKFRAPQACTLKREALRSPPKPSEALRSPPKPSEAPKGERRDPEARPTSLICSASSRVLWLELGLLHSHLKCWQFRNLQSLEREHRLPSQGCRPYAFRQGCMRSVWKATARLAGINFSRSWSVLSLRVESSGAWVLSVRQARFRGIQQPGGSAAALAAISVALPRAALGGATCSARACGAQGGACQALRLPSGPR